MPDARTPNSPASGSRPTEPEDAPPLLAIALVSACALAYEVLLLRLLAVVQWHHVASMIVSLALLGYGASGTVLALAAPRLAGRFRPAFAAGAALFGLSAVGSAALAQRVPFNALELLWDWRQPLLLSAFYALLAVPFFFAAGCVALAFYRFRDGAGRIYACDLAGAGVGAAGVVALLFLAKPAQALAAIGAGGFFAAALAAGGGGRRRLAAALAVAAAVVLFGGGRAPWTEPRPSPYKDLSQALQVAGARAVGERSSPLGLVTVVESPRAPFRHAPGLSLRSPVEPPEQLALFADGNLAGVINRMSPAGAPPGYLDFLTSALPYHLRDRPRVLVLGAGGGAEVAQALLHQARSVDAVELNPDVVDLVRRDHADFAGRLYERAGVRVHVAEARGFLARGGEAYDLIQVSLLDSYAAASAGLLGVNESYLYTVEALGLMLARLGPGGVLAITRWLKLPPRDSLKLVATAAEALGRLGAPDAGRRLALIRGWSTSTLLVMNGAFDDRETARLREFADARGFDVAYYPGMSSAEANRYNRLDRPYLHEGATALLGPDVGDFIGRYKFRIEPATDARPYFFDFFRWRLLPELLAEKGRGGLGILDWGYPLLAATLAQATAVGALLILLPLAWARRRMPAAGAISRRRVLLYFAAIGLAFMFLEMAFIQRLVLLLHHPVYAAAAALSAFLLFAGLGSLAAGRRRAAANPARMPAAAIAAVAVVYAAALPAATPMLEPLPLPAKLAIAVLLVAPLAFPMGMPFPLGLAGLGRGDPGLIPWAWAINGAASVVGALLAQLLAVEVGFAWAMAAAAALYLLAAAAFPGASRRSRSGGSGIGFQ